MFKLKKRSRFNYWRCSKFADWIRGIPKPFALEWDAWDTWHKDAKDKHPFRYWIADELLDKLQDTVNLPIDLYHTLDIYIRNRFIDKIHYLKTGLKPGEYYDFDHRILHGLFNELVNLVEKEYAYMQGYDKSKSYKFVNGRCAEAGVDYLNWSSGLTYTEDYLISSNNPKFNQPIEQAIVAAKTLELYNWWKNRVNRPDPFDLYNETKDGKLYWKKIDKAEREYTKEDTKMLIQLIKIRTALWT